jgi:hypothetical protein
MFGSWFSTRPPACPRCAIRIRFQRIGSLLLTLAIAAVILFFVWPHSDDFVARPVRKWAAMGLLIVCLSPYFLWEFFFPPSIDITAYRNSIDYEFRNKAYAFEFARLNQEAEWVKILSDSKSSGDRLWGEWGGEKESPNSTSQ